MEYKLVQLTDTDPEIIAQITAIEQEAFGIGGMNSWFLPPFIRHGRVYVLLTASDQVAAVIEYMRDFNDHNHLYLFGLAVHKDRRGQGLGKRIVAETLRSLREAGFTSVSLTVHPNNSAAINLYTSLGFVQGEFLAQEYGQDQDRIVLKCELQ